MAMDPDDDTERMLADAQLSLDERLALAWARASDRAALTAVRSIWHEVGGIPGRCSDPQVARTRLEWWQRELERLHHGQAQHPATRVLQADGRAGVMLELGDDLIVAVRAEIQPGGTADLAALMAHLRRRHAGYFEGLGQVLGIPVGTAVLDCYAAARGGQRLLAGDPAMLGCLPRRPTMSVDQRREDTLNELGNIMIVNNNKLSGLGSFLGATLALAVAEGRGEDLGAFRRLWRAWSAARRAS